MSTAAVQNRPGWVMDLGRYGRASWEWLTLDSRPTLPPSFYQDLEIETETLVNDRVRELAAIEGPPLSEDPFLLRVAAEIEPCLRLIYRPTDRWLDPIEQRLIETRAWMDRPPHYSLVEVATEITEATDQGLPLGIELGWCPTGYFPTELTVMSELTGLDLYSQP